MQGTRGPSTTAPMPTREGSVDSKDCGKNSAGKVPVFFIGAMSHGTDNFADAEEFVLMSNYHISASAVCGKICHFFEELWNVL